LPPGQIGFESQKTAEAKNGRKGDTGVVTRYTDAIVVAVVIGR